jgi:hypothetical protein
MSEPQPTGPSRPVDRETWTRIGRLTRGAFGTVRDVYTRVVLGAMSGAVLGSVIGFGIAPSIAGLAGALVAAAIPVLIGAVPLVRADLRRAFELVLDLRRSGDLLWKAVDGTAAPESRGAARSWLDSRPGGPIPISVLLVAGRLEEADQAIAGLGGVPPDAAFDVELLRQTRRLYGGDTPDLTVVGDLWRTLPQPRRDVARGELAMLEAQAVAADGGDPVALLAAARSDLSRVHWSVRAPVFVGGWILVPIGATVGSWVVRQALPFWRPG